MNFPPTDPETAGAQRCWTPRPLEPLCAPAHSHDITSQIIRQLSILPKLLKITVMLGGPSTEREVSLRSGAQVAGALRSLGHTVHELDPQGENWDLPKGTQVVFLALHGTYGEDGTVQRQLDELGVPYTGCDAESSRVAFDKVLTKQRRSEEHTSELQSPDHLV